MELGFIMAMACLVTVGCIYLCLIVKNERRKCGSCKFFTPKGKYCGTCNGFGESRFKWELCGHWKRIPKEESKEESFKKGDWVRIVAYHNDYILSWVGPNLPLILENQQPFYANGLSFIHNGDISDDQGRNIITNRAFPVDPSIVQSTGGRSDSAIFFAVILQYIGFGFALDEAVAQAVRELRKSYPKSSYNCMIQSQDQFIALCAAGREVTSKRIVEIYDQYGRGEQARDYRVLRYRALGGNDDAQPKGVVVASSGFDQRAEDGWTRLENDQMIVASNRTGEFRVRSI